MAIWYIIWPFVNLVVFWYIFPRFGSLYPEKIWQPCDLVNCITKNLATLPAIWLDVKIDAALHPRIAARVTRLGDFLAQWV
jgi:hypothetical protein